MSRHDAWRHRPRKFFLATTTALLVFAALAPWQGASAYTYQVLYSFCSQPNCTDGVGVGLNGGLIIDKDGNLYGTTSSGGAFNKGTVFELTPNANKTVWTETVLYSFCSDTNCADGAVPWASLIVDRDGNLYGTTAEGGVSGNCGWPYFSQASCGILFELTPSADRTVWTETVLYYFCSQTNCDDGFSPASALIMDKKGNLYGGTRGGGRHAGCQRFLDKLICFGGTVFEMTPNAEMTRWTEKVIHDFCGGGSYERPCPDGEQSTSLTMAEDGNLYGGTQPFGARTGTVFQLTPKPTQTKWENTVIYRAGVSVAPIFDNDGNLYGRTGQPYSVFELIPNKAKTKWAANVLYDRRGINGVDEIGGVIIDNAGNLYGTAYSGGAGTDCSQAIATYGCGTVIELTSPKSHPNKQWNETVLYNFCAQPNCTDGLGPGLLTMDKNHNLYGTTDQGGASGDGVAFMLRP